MQITIEKIKDCRNCYFNICEKNSFDKYCANKKRLKKDKLGCFILENRTYNNNACKYWRKREEMLSVYDFNYFTGELNE